MPVHIMQTLDVASRITLFLVGQAGPLSFTFKDRLENKYVAVHPKEMTIAFIRCIFSSKYSR
jgi:hypothetical protein